MCACECVPIYSTQIYEWSMGIWSNWSDLDTKESPIEFMSEDSLDELTDQNLVDFILLV